MMHPNISKYNEKRETKRNANTTAWLSDICIFYYYYF